MKKTVRIISLIIALMTAVSLASCSAAQTEEEGHREYATDDEYLTEETIEDKITIAKAAESEVQTTVAQVKNNDTGDILSFSDIAEAWSNAMSRPDESLTMTIFTDWTAADGSFKTGENQVGFGKTGGLEFVKRNARFFLNLNEHTIDRGLTSPTEAGSVISVNTNCFYFELKNGNVKGGYSKGRGGAIYINTSDSVLINTVNIIENHAVGNGGGIYISAKKGWVWLKNTYIYDNVSDNYGGGIYLDATTKNLFKDVYCELGFSCWAYIEDNTGKDGRNNLIVRNSNTKGNSYISHFNAMFSGSVIYVNTSKNATGEYVTKTFEEDGFGADFMPDYLYCDNPNYTLNPHKKLTYSKGMYYAADFHYEVVKK